MENLRQIRCQISEEAYNRLESLCQEARLKKANLASLLFESVLRHPRLSLHFEEGKLWGLSSMPPPTQNPNLEHLNSTPNNDSR